MSNLGYLGWSDPFTPISSDGAFWLGGRYYKKWPEVSNPFAPQPADGVTVLETHAGTHIVQIPYRGLTDPMIADRFTFATGFLADDREDFRHLDRQRSLGAPVLFFPGIPVTETFQAPGSFTLLRAKASDIVPGVSSAAYPEELHLDGTLAPSAATISGRSVSAGSSGILAVTYYPVFACIVQGVQWALTDTEQLAVTFTLLEIIS